MLYTKHTCKLGDFYTLPDGTNIQNYTRDKRWPQLEADIKSGKATVKVYAGSAAETKAKADGAAADKKLYG